MSSVREAALVVALGGLLARSDALAFAIISRVILTVVDALGAATGLLLSRHNSHRQDVDRPA